MPGGKISDVDLKSEAEVALLDVNEGNGGKAVDTDEEVVVLDDDGKLGGTGVVGNNDASLSELGPVTLNSGKMVLRLKLTYEDPPGGGLFGSSCPWVVPY